MPVEGRDLSSRRTQHVVRDLEIGEPINSEECSETAEGVARESEGRSRLPFLCPVRQDQPRGHPGPCLCPVPLQQGRAGCGWPGVHGHRGVWGAAVARRTGACAQAADLSTGPYQKSVHTEGQRQAQAAGHLDPAGSSLHDSSDAGVGTDLRSRPPTRAVCLPSWAQCATGGGRGGSAARPWPPGSRRCRPRGLLREHSPCRASPALTGRGVTARTRSERASGGLISATCASDNLRRTRNLHPRRLLARSVFWQLHPGILKCVKLHRVNKIKDLATMQPMKRLSKGGSRAHCRGVSTESTELRSITFSVAQSRRTCRFNCQCRLPGWRCGLGGQCGCHSHSG